MLANASCTLLLVLMILSVLLTEILFERFLGANICLHEILLGK